MSGQKIDSKNAKRRHQQSKGFNLTVDEVALIIHHRHLSSGEQSGVRSALRKLADEEESENEN